MTTSRELVVRTLNHQPVERAPRDLWTLPGVRMFRADEIEKMLRRFPEDIVEPDFIHGKGALEEGTPHEVGEYRDAWGCVWKVAEAGVIGEVKTHPLASYSALARFKLPRELLDDADFSRVNPGCLRTSCFVLAGSTVRPFERAQFLRGTEALFVDLAYGAKEVRTLLEMLHDFYTRELEMWAATDVDGVSFMDDWGSQTSLLISPDMWRDVFKPLYVDYCDILHRMGKYAFFHSDGDISLIVDELIEVGIDALNSQLFCMDIEKLGERFAGRLTFWGEIDRQRIMPFGTEDEVRQAVRRVRKALDRGRGGVIAECEWGLDVPYENVAAVFDEWLRPLDAYSDG